MGRMSGLAESLW